MILGLTPACWADIDARLRQLARSAPGGALLSVSLALDSGGQKTIGGGATDWLDLQPKAQDFCYWARPSEDEYRLGLGRAVVCTSAGPARFTALQAAHAGIIQHWRHDDGGTGDAPIACLGFAFDDEGGDPLPNAQLGVPAVLLHRRRRWFRATFSTPVREVTNAIQRWQDLLEARVPAALPAIPPDGDSTLARRAWTARIDAAAMSIAAGELEKVVLSRTRHLSLEGDASITAPLRALIARQPLATVYAHGNRHAVFLGASPERLVGVSGRAVRADALAGTGWRDQSLLAEKNRREQALVVEAVSTALAPLCLVLHVPNAPDVMELQGLRHLRTAISGELTPGITLFDLVSALHPTPAVGGWPSAAARDWLRRHHEQRRGWYSGGIGWIDPDGNGEVAVALRCALIEGRHVELMAGAGIVAGSDARQEFDETEAKLATVLDALRDGSGEQRRTGT